MAVPNSQPNTTPSTDERDLTTTAEVLTAKEILNELGEQTTMIHRVDPPPPSTGWLRRLLAWIGLK